MEPYFQDDDNEGIPFFPEKWFYQPSTENYQEDDNEEFPFIPEKGFYQRSTENYQEDDNEGFPFIPEKGFYQPSNDESWEAYQALITVVQDQLGGFPSHVICGASDEVLSVLKSSVLFGSRAKKIEMEKLLGPIPEFTFDQLLVIGDLINDYSKTQNRDDQEEDGFLIYKPTNEETWRNYNLFLDVVGQLSGVEDRTVLRLGADGILSVLKNEEIEKVEWKKEAIEFSHLGPISDQTFDHLMFMGTLITDYPKPSEPQSSQSQDLASTSRDPGTGNSSMGPTVEFIKEEKKVWNANDAELPCDEFIPYDELINDVDDEENEIVGQEFYPTIKDEVDEDDDDKEIVGPESYPTVKDEVDADFDEMVRTCLESDDGDDSSETAMTDETGSEIKFEKVDFEKVLKSDVEDEEWVVVASESFNDTDDDDDTEG